MSADDGIYILKTLGKGDAEAEYRVKHMQSIENYLYDGRTNDVSADPDVHIANARNMWGECKPVFNEIAANEEANRIYQAWVASYGDSPEYGTQTITIPRVF